MVATLGGAVTLQAGEAPGTAPPLPALGADAAQTSVSGLSSGAFMAVQLQVAHSRRIVGAGVVAGGPYFCAQGTAFSAAYCMGQVPFFTPDPQPLLTKAREFARQGKIDALSHLGQRRIYLFSGTDDIIVRQPVMDATKTFFELAGVPAGQIRYDDKVPAGHAVIAPGADNDCAANAGPYINHCTVNGQAYDQAGTLLQHIHGPLQPKVAQPQGRLQAFDQTPFAKALPGALADTGYVYVPPACEVGLGVAACRVHVAIHGCGQSVQVVGDQFTAHAGYNGWADNNRFLVLYPQVNKSRFSPFNPAGCWDWWGYTGQAYALKSGVQMQAIMRMVDRLAERP